MKKSSWWLASHCERQCHNPSTVHGSNVSNQKRDGNSCGSNGKINCQHDDGSLNGTQSSYKYNPGDIPWLTCGDSDRGQFTAGRR